MRSGSNKDSQATRRRRRNQILPGVRDPARYSRRHAADNPLENQRYERPSGRLGMQPLSAYQLSTKPSAGPLRWGREVALTAHSLKTERSRAVAAEMCSNPASPHQLRSTRGSSCGGSWSAWSVGMQRWCRSSVARNGHQTKSVVRSGLVE